MPQTSQIMPKYSHPYVDEVVNNNTTITDDNNALNNVTDETYPYLQVFTSSKGLDNKLVCIESLKDFHSKFGVSNYKLYGQPFLNAETILNQVNTKVWSMRIMPSDASYANSVLSLWYKADKDAKKFRIKFTTKSFSKYAVDGKVDSAMEKIVADRDALIEKGASLDGVAVDGVYVDSEGYTQVPLAIMTSVGRGTYGNDLRWRISLNQNCEKEYGFKLYSFESIDTTDGTTLLSTMVGSIVSSNMVKEACFINDIIEEATVENISMHVHVYESNVEDLYDAYKKFAESLMVADPSLDIDIPDEDKFDPLFGYAVASPKVKITPADSIISFTQEKTAEIDETAPGYVAANYTTTKTVLLGDVTGNTLANGHDGAFTVDKVSDPTGSIRHAAINAAYISAFEGSLDTTILSSRRIPSNALFDANFDMDVKKAYAKLALFRNDAILYLDTNQRETLSLADASAMETDFEVINTLDDEFTVFSNYLISYNLHYYNIKEASTGKRIPVTITYYLATIHPNHWRTYGYHVPMVGEDYATLTGHIKNSLKPSIEEYEGDLMSRLNDSRFNFFECTGENVFMRATQNTSVVEKSDLLEENNVNTLLYIKRNITADARSEIYNFTDSTSRSDFVDFIKAKYNPLVGTQIYSIDVKYDMNAWEFERSIVHLYIAVKFRQLAKQVIVEIDLNKRSYEDE